MGQAVKYILLGVTITIILGLVAAFINGLYPTEILNNFLSYLNAFTTFAGDAIHNVRGFLNSLLGSHLPLTISIAFWIIVPFVRVAIKVVIMVARWINQ